MRISDWSSDVCSSDLAWIETLAGSSETNCKTSPPARRRGSKLRQCVEARRPVESPPARRRGSKPDAVKAIPIPEASPPARRRGSKLREDRVSGEVDRSEEHTSELQSLMRSSYAVVCLKKQNTK